MPAATPATDTKLQIVNAVDIYNKKLPPTKWYVGEVIHEGVSLLSGDPKVGKSFFALQVGLAVAGSGPMVFGSIPVRTHGRVLYLALDDRSEKRMHKRLHDLCEDEGALALIDVVNTGDYPSLSHGFDQVLDRALAGQNFELVVLDTLGAISDVPSSKSLYSGEYQEMIKLQALAQKYNLCILVIHHTNKGDGMGGVSKASGTHGRTGGVDSVLLLSSGTKGVAQLDATPRDGEQATISLTARKGGGWQAMEPGAVYAPATRLRFLSPEQQQTKDALASGPMDKGKLAMALGLSEDSTARRLNRYQREDLVRRGSGGEYSWAGDRLLAEPVRPVRVSESPVIEASVSSNVYVA
jgi:hypothetical protein